jgi:acyl-coenzyme A thioesterase 13
LGRIHAVASHGLEKTGASIDLHVTYFGTAQVGGIIEVEAVATRVGSSVAFTTIKIYRVIDGEQGPIVATALYTKCI